MEADISILRKPGHFYFALTRGGSYEAEVTDSRVSEQVNQ
jgi:hypothetical protein